LRERAADLPLLVEHILQQASPQTSIAADAHEAIVAYPWPGNIRELKNVILQAASLCEDSTLRLEHLPALVAGAGARKSSEDLAVLARAERSSIIQTIEESGGRLSVAASVLGIHRTTLYRKMQRHGIAIRSKYPGADN
jgi:transcriptional regulator of acetoin/glycerol metabolism